MQLLPLELRAQLPQLYTQETEQDPVVYLKFFTPNSNWTWYVTEGEATDSDVRFFGFMVGLEKEWGYFMLSELETAKGPLGLPIERDLHFAPQPFSKIKRLECL